MHGIKTLYHGSEISGLEVLEPKTSLGFDKRYVYATDSLIEAVIFLSRKRNSMQASWDIDTDVPYFCERSKGVFNKWYSGVSGSIYVLPVDNFRRNERLSEHEFVSPNPVKVLDEIGVKDAKTFLNDLAAQGKMKIIRYEDRRALFPDDSDLVEMCMSGLKKYSVEFTLERIRRLQPQLEREFMKRLKEKETGQKQKLH